MSFNFSNIGSIPLSQPNSLQSGSQPSLPFPHNPSPGAQALQTPSNPFPQATTANHSNSARPEIDPSILNEENVPVRFIDALANQFGFGDIEQDLRQNLHGFAKVIFMVLYLTIPMLITVDLEILDGARTAESRYCY